MATVFVLYFNLFLTSIFFLPHLSFAHEPLYRKMPSRPFFSITFLLLILTCFIYDGVQAAYQVPIIPTDTGRTCAPGEFDNGNACQPCAPGTFQDISNQFLCKPCQPGTFSPARENQEEYFARTYCSACGYLNFQDQAGQSFCKSCPANSIPNENTTEPNNGCKTCEAPLYVQDQLCKVCGAGKFLHTNQHGQRTCHDCPRGTYTDTANQTMCKTCPSGSFAVNVVGPCRLCPPGTFENGSTCEPCSEGFYQPNAGATSCLACPNGTFTNETQALFCFSNNVSVTCSPGEFVSNGRCHKCGAGSVSPGGNVMSCFSCVRPSFADEFGTSCICPSQYGRRYSGDRYARRGCHRCGVNSASDGVKCQCLPALYYDEGRNKCACPAGQRYNGVDCEPCGKGVVPGESDCDYCVTRYAVNKQTGKCERCSQRTCCGNTFDAECGCPEGMFFFTRAGLCFCSDQKYGAGHSPSSPDMCKPCRPDEYGALGSCMKRCTWKADPSYSVWNGETCVPCPDGYQNVNNICTAVRCAPSMRVNRSSGHCECREITLADGSCRTCDRAANLRYSQSTGQCVCKFGTTWRDGRCVECEPGFTTNLKGACVPCGSKRFRMSGQRRCRFCKEGDPDVEVAAQCVPGACAEDEFVGTDGACRRCEKGQRLVNRRCVDCAHGSVSAGGRTAYCSKCIAGSIPTADRGACVPK